MVIDLRHRLRRLRPRFAGPNETRSVSKASANSALLGVTVPSLCRNTPKLYFRAWIVAENIRRLRLFCRDQLEPFSQRDAMLSSLLDDFAFHVAQTRKTGRLLLRDHELIVSQSHYTAV